MHVVLIRFGVLLGRREKPSCHDKSLLGRREKPSCHDNSVHTRESRARQSMDGLASKGGVCEGEGGSFKRKALLSHGNQLRAFPPIRVSTFV